MNFDVLSFILGKRGDGGPICDIVSYLMGKLVGFITEVVNDVYEELRSAPIHTSITIDGNVYPRVDNTRLGLETIKGRTVARNQLCPLASSGFFYNNGLTSLTFDTNEKTTMFKSASAIGQPYFGQNVVGGHRLLVTFEIVELAEERGFFLQKDSSTDYTWQFTQVGKVAKIFTPSSFWQIKNYANTANDTVLKNLMVFDLTLMYGPARANAIYAMEQATPGAGVAYVRQRLPLDYYAYNAGTLTAPVVSGWSVTDTDEQTTTLSLPSTTLNGVGTAQDYIEAVEVAENDYSLIKHTLTGSVNLGSLEWTYNSDSTLFFGAINGLKNAIVRTLSLICPRYECIDDGRVIENVPDKSIYNRQSPRGVLVKDSAYTDAAAFKTAMSGVYCVYPLDTPTETTIAEHLTLAEVSMLAENGGIIGIVNANGDIVQPDLTVTTVINKSATTN